MTGLVQDAAFSGAPSAPSISTAHCTTASSPYSIPIGSWSLQSPSGLTSPPPNSAPSVLRRRNRIRSPPPTTHHFCQWDRLQPQPYVARMFPSILLVGTTFHFTSPSPPRFPVLDQPMSRAALDFNHHFSQTPKSYFDECNGSRKVIFTEETGE